MTDTQKVANKEFNDIDQALRRAAVNAKKQAEQHGTPYVIYRQSSAGLLLNQPSQNKK